MHILHSLGVINFSLLRRKVLEKDYNGVQQMLLLHGTDPNIIDGEKYPLLDAVLLGYHDILGLLLSFGARVNLLNSSPLACAAFLGDFDTVKILLEFDSDPDYPSLQDGNSTPLIQSAGGGYFKISNILLKYGANPNKKNDLGYSPLSCAAQHGYTQIVALLLENNADPNMDVYVSPLYLASQNGHYDIVTILLQYHANPDTEAPSGMTPLCIASENGYIEVVKALIMYDADLTKTCHGNVDTAHQIAFHYNNDEIGLLIKDAIHKHQLSGEKSFFHTHEEL